MLTAANYAASRGVPAALTDAYAARETLRGHLYALRDSTGLTTADFATRLGITAADVERVEDADFEGVTIGVLERYADALGCTISASIVGADAPTVYRLTEQHAAA